GCGEGSTARPRGSSSGSRSLSRLPVSRLASSMAGFSRESASCFPPCGTGSPSAGSIATPVGREQSSSSPCRLMPELPVCLVLFECLRPRVVGQTLERVRLASPFLLRSVEPPLEEVEGKTVHGLRRLGKRIVFELDEELFLVLHLMIAGRLHWKE